jgi:Holliday junction resolvase
MSSKAKRKGNGFEVEVVKVLKQRGFVAERAWGSNGIALGEAPDVDIIVRLRALKFRLQAKRRARLPQYLTPSETVDAVVARADRGETLIVLRLDEFLTLMGG